MLFLSCNKLCCLHPVHITTQPHEHDDSTVLNERHLFVSSHYIEVVKSHTKQLLYVVEFAPSTF